jgi:hypothetical protein
MTSTLDSELRACFEETTEFVHPPSDMADRVRRAAKRRQRRVAAAFACATAAVVIVAGSGFLAAHDWRQAGKHTSAPVNRGHGLSITFPDGYTALQLATAGPYLYAMIGPPDGGQGATLAAYDRLTGRLVRQVSIPGAGGSALAVGPGGLVWLSFAADTMAARPTGTWLLSPDLRLHSSGPGGDISVLLPVSRTAALVPDQHGLLLVRMPVPGQPGWGTAQLEKSTSLGPALNTAPGVSAAALDGRIVVQVTNGYGFDSHLVIAGQPHTTFGGRANEQAGYLADTGHSLWVQTYAVHGQNATGYGQLVRLDSRLQPTTPKAILDSPVLAKTVQVWTYATTVWAVTAVPGYPLVCFAAGSRTGPVTSLPTSDPVTALASSGDTVYVTTTPADAASGIVRSYPVPAACR